MTIKQFANLTRLDYSLVRSAMTEGKVYKFKSPGAEYDPEDIEADVVNCLLHRIEFHEQRAEKMKRDLNRARKWQKYLEEEAANV